MNRRRFLQTIAGSASAVALNSRNASDVFGRELPTLPTAEQVWLIDSLAARSNALARAAITASLESADGGVRRAAAAALARIA